MGCRILYDTRDDMATLYCSTSMVSFGPVFTESEEGVGADERAEAFLRWLDSHDPSVRWTEYEPNPIVDRGRRDPRVLSEAGLERAYSDWLAQEAEQMKREDAANSAEI